MNVHPAMEPWPVLAWVLMLTSIADWMKIVRSRDFTEKDIIFLHPSSKCTNLRSGVVNVAIQGAGRLWNWTSERSNKAKLSEVATLVNALKMS